MLRSAKGSTPFRNASASTSGPGLAGSSTAASRSGSVTSVSGLWPSNHGSNTNNEIGMHPNLGLHNAAATGNVGLVKFALDNGQPHTSILNGLFPLHAACSGGSEPVVRLLLSYGADVNATRIKVSKNSSANTGTGAEGSTPLHFAAANGHLAIIRLLLEHGARPTAKDKDGYTPEALATSQGHDACVELLKAWITSYGPNGLAGLVPGTTASGVNSTSSSLDQNGQLTSSSSSIPSQLRNQRSFEQLSSAAAGVKASLRNHKKQALAKVSSNPNLKASTSNPSLLSPSTPPPPLPTTTRGDLDVVTTRGGNAPPSGPSQSLSSAASSNLLNRESKRRPSLPSIFERAGNNPSSSFRLGLPPDSIEELSFDIVEPRSKSSSTLPPPSPNRTNHRMTGKRSMTGLMRKSNGANDSPLPGNEMLPPPLPSPRINERQDDRIDTASLNQSETTPKLDTFSHWKGIAAAPEMRGRSISTDMMSPPSLSNISLHDNAASRSSQASSTSSFENFDLVGKQPNTASGGGQHSSRPRKASNLSNNTSPLISHSQLEELPNTFKTMSPLTRFSNLTVEHGRKRSQSTTSVPKSRPSDKLEDRKHSFSQQGSKESSRQSREDVINDDTLEFLTASSAPIAPTTKDRSNNQQIRFRNYTSSTNRSPLLPSKSLTEDNLSTPSYFPSHPSSPLFAIRQLRSTESSSSLVSSASSSNTNNMKQSRNAPRTVIASPTYYGTPEEEVYQGQKGSKTIRSPPTSEVMTRKTSTSSMRSFGIGLTAQEQAQAILKSAEGGVTTTTSDGTPISLTQMLAAYGEALAQERKNVESGSTLSPTSSTNLRKQASLASLGSNNQVLSSVTEAVPPAPPPPLPLPLPSTESTSSSSVRVNQGSLTPFSTPPDSPQTTRSRADSSSTSFSRSPSSSNRPPRGLAEVIADRKNSTKSTPPPTTTTNQQLQLPPQSAAGLHYPSLQGKPVETLFGTAASAGIDVREQYRDQFGDKCASPPPPPPPSMDPPAHRHSPSLPTDLTQFSSNATVTTTTTTSPLMSTTSNTSSTTPRPTTRKNSHRPTTSDSHSSLDQLHGKRGGEGVVVVPPPPPPSNLSTIDIHQMQRMASASDMNGVHQNNSFPTTLDSDPYWSTTSNVGGNRFATSQSNLNLTGGTRRDDGSISRSSSRGASKRKGSTVKAFLNGIKNNVVG